MENFEVDGYISKLREISGRLDGNEECWPSVNDTLATTLVTFINTNYDVETGKKLSSNIKYPENCPWLVPPKINEVT